MKIKKAAAFFLVLMLAASMISGCGGGNNAAGTKGSSGSAAVTQSSATEPVKEDPLEFTIAYPTMGLKYVTNTTNWSNEPFKQEVEKRTNTKITYQWLDYTNLEQSYNLMFASGDVPDLVMDYNITRTSVDTAIKNGVFMELKDLINQYAPGVLKKVNPDAWAFMSVYNKGDIYAIPSYMTYKSKYATYIRKDLLDKYSLAVPDTVDEYINMLRVFKKNGVKYPYAGRENFAYVNGFFGAYGVSVYEMYKFDAEGKLVPSAILPEMKQALTTMRQLYQEGLLDKEFLTTNGTDWMNNIRTGLTGMHEHNASSFTTWEQPLEQNVPGASFILTGAPKGPDGLRGANNEPKPSDGKVTMVNAKTKDPVRLMKFIEWTTTDEALELFSFGVEGKANFKYPTDTEDLEKLSYRLNPFYIAKNYGMDELLIDLQPGGTVIKDYVNKFGNKDYVDQVFLLGGDLEIYKTQPELKCNGTDVNSLFNQYAAKIIYGVEPIDAFDKFVAEWKSRGGDKVLEELDAKVKAGLIVK